MEQIKVKNSLTGNIDTINIKKSKPLNFYICGPTIYDKSHIGHGRNFVGFDIMRRILTYFGYHVRYVMNITDIDDKIMRRIKELKGYRIYMNLLSIQIKSKDFSELENIHSISKNYI